MVELRRERHTFPSMRVDERGKLVPADITVDAEVLNHERGFRLIRLGKSPPFKGEKFRYVRRDVSFEFFANRTHWGGTVAGTYCVVADFKPGQMLGSDAWPVEEARMKAFAADIDAGLRAWPPTPVEEARPLGVVHVHFFTFSASLHTDYTFAFGQPLTLRDVPPSPRWAKRKVRHRVTRRGTQVLAEFSAMVRDDGVKVVRMPTSRGPADDGPDAYHYAEGDLAFDFTAERRFTVLIVTDTWEVQLNPPGRDGGLAPAMRARLGPARCAEIVRTIEEALFAWITEPFEDEERQVPVNRVVFSMPMSRPDVLQVAAMRHLVPGIIVP
jgi:hypothetical protein